jgi:hypothetical protein
VATWAYHQWPPAPAAVSNEVIDHDAHVLHALNRPALDRRDISAAARASLGCRSAGGNAPPIGLKKTSGELLGT